MLRIQRMKLFALIVLSVGLSLSLLRADSVVALAPMHEPRAGHTATLLNDGTVLLLGGESQASIPSTVPAEIFDPGTRSFQLIEPMKSFGVRGPYPAALLADGKVLIAAGHDARIYDPTTRAFRDVGQMREPRIGHSVTSLHDGRVLVAGGFNPLASMPYSSTEIYDPASETFSSGPPMLSRRARHAATVLHDGRVVLAGGTERLLQGGTPVTLRTVEIFNPARGTFEQAPSLLAARTYPSSTLLPDGRIVFMGGRGDFFGEVGIVSELYDPLTGPVRDLGGPPPALALNSHAAVLLPRGEILVSGGRPDGSTWLLNIERFTWTRGAPLAHDRTASPDDSPYQLAATLLRDGKVLFTGGYIRGFEPTRYAELYVSMTSLKMQGNRFAVELMGRNPADGRLSEGGPVKVNEKFGYFYFPQLTSDAGNPEVFVKIVGPLPDGAFLLFHASLTHVEHWLTVTDTHTGRTKIYEKPAGGFLALVARGSSGNGCQNDRCVSLRAGLFSITADAMRQDRGPFSATRLLEQNQFGIFALPDLTGDRENPEIIVKAVGPFPNGDYIIFAAGMTDAEATITIRSVVDGVAQAYQLQKPPGDFHSDVLSP